MDHTLVNQKPKNKNPFLCCFGFSGQTIEKEKQKVNSVDRKKNKWKFQIPWSRLKTKKLCLYEKVHADDKIGRKSLLPVAGKVATQVLLEGHKPVKKKNKPAQDEILEHSKSLYSGNSPKTELCQIRLCAEGKSEAQVGKINLPRSLELVTKSSQKTTLLSKPSSTLQKQKDKVSIDDETLSVHERKAKIKSESVYGLSIIMVTLLIMLIWGKLCAIICTSVWIYFVPRLKRTRGSDAGEYSAENGSIVVNTNMDYEKKKVVLEGFLERNRRSTLRVFPNTKKDVGLSG